MQSSPQDLSDIFHNTLGFGTTVAYGGSRRTGSKPMRVILADSYGMCFGVRDAIEMALQLPDRRDLTILGELVHNPVVLGRLQGAGIRSVSSPDEPVETTQVMVTAHGASQRAIAGLRRRGLVVHEATCPLVTHAHRSLQRLVAAGFFPVVIGRPDHVEVRGLVGDLDDFAVIQRPEQVFTLAGRDRLGVVAQTTQPPDLVQEIVTRIRQAYPTAEVRFVDTTCQPTRERQAAAHRIARECEVVVVVGGRSSNNTLQLVRACEAEGARVYQVEGAADLNPEWFRDVGRVGLTAGTSTPDNVISAVHEALLRIAEWALPLAA